MPSVDVGNVRAHARCDGAELAATIRLGAEAHEVWFRTAQLPAPPTADPFVPIAVVPAMQHAGPVHIDGSVSPRLLRGAARAQQTLAIWYPTFRVVGIEAPTRVPAPRPSEVAACFTGGVDSFYTLQKHRHEITHLVFVHGFDIPLARRAYRQAVSEALRGTADELGLELIEVETNLRDFTDRYGDWAQHFHGAAIAAVGLFLAPRIGTFFIPSTYAYAHLFPWGSHPGLDPRWSTESLTVVHDGCEVTRFEKVEALAGWDTALRTLRVCWQLDDDTYNCGRCRKCVWTMACLRACGVLDRALRFDRPFTPEALLAFPLEEPYERARFMQALAVLEERNEDRSLQEVLHAALHGTAPSTAAAEAERALAPG